VSHSCRQRTARPHAIIIIIANADGDTQPERESLSDCYRKCDAQPRGLRQHQPDRKSQSFLSVSHSHQQPCGA
jgi:hypothetical protein